MLPLSYFVYNTWVHSSTGVSPHEAFMGRPARMPIDLILKTPSEGYQTANAYVMDTLNRFSQMFKYMRDKQETSFARSARTYSAKENNYQTGDLVWLFCNIRVKAKSPKFMASWTGPYSVVKRHSQVLVDVRPTLINGRVKTVHCTRLAKYYGPWDARRPVYPLEEDGDDSGDGILDNGDELAERVTFEGTAAQDLITPFKFVPTTERGEKRLPSTTFSDKDINTRTFI